MTLDRLRAAPLLADLPDEMLTALLDAAGELKLQPGEVLMAEGETATALFVVLEGELEVTKCLDGADVMLAVCVAGDLLGELSMVHGRPRSATVRATTPVSVLRIEPDTLTELLTRPNVAVTLLATVTRRLEELELQLRQHDRMAQLGTLTAGLLHELNNPAAAIARSTGQLGAALEELQTLPLGRLAHDVPARMAGLLDGAVAGSSGLARLDAEERLERTLDDADLHGCVGLATSLAALGVDPDRLARTLGELSQDDRDTAVRWLALRGRLARLAQETGVAAGRISEVVGAVKRYSHVDEAAVQEVDVHDGLEAALTLLGGRVPSGVEIVRRYEAGLPTIEGFPGDLNTVWTNLLDNALDAVGERGRITICTRARADDVEVTVENTGPAVSDEVIERVFDPFFTTKPIGKGTGLGLATSHGVVVNRHRGRMEMTSAPDATRVSVVLPRGGARAAAATTPTSGA
jgi:signal transduction histidine kinase